MQSSPLSQISEKMHVNNAVLTGLQLLGAAFAVGLAAHIKIPLFFTPIPLSLQTFAVLLIGSFLGSRKGAASVLMYIALAVAGMPFFASGPASFSHLIGPSGGYLVGFVLQAFLAGWVVERKLAKNIATLSAALFVCCLIQLSIGSLWLAQFTSLSIGFALGFVPFLAGEALKSLVVAVILSRK